MTFRPYPKPQRRVKVGRSGIGHAKPQLYGITFDSGLERDLYLLLKNDPEVAEVQIKASVHLTRAKILYKPDYKVLGRNGVEWFCEAKGFEDEKWRIKRRLWMHYGPGELRIYHRQGKKGIVLHEVIVPKGDGDVG